MGLISLGKLWVLEAGSAAYAFGVDDNDHLIHTYWGARLPHHGDYPRAVLRPSFGFESPLQLTPMEVVTGEAGAFYERTVDLNVVDGPRGLVLRYISAKVSENSVEITLGDAATGASVVVHYAVDEASGLFLRKLSVGNGGDAAFKIRRAFGATFNLPGTRPYAVTHLDGRWGDEFRMRRQHVGPGAFVRESRRISTSHGGVPWFAIDHVEPALSAGQENGEVWFGALAWSGNWKLIAEQTRDGRAIVHLGQNDHDFAYDLKPGERFETPEVYFGYTGNGFGEASRQFHDLIRDTYGPRRNYVPPVVYNSWYATLFDVSEPGQTALAEKAAALGVEMFVVDDGWFSGRVDDKAGLGDWWPDKNKFAGGLAPLAEAVHALGMKFGVWIEPEMVNPDSDLYRAHPDWIIGFERRERTLARNQLILNLGRQDVRDHLISVFDTLLTENPIDFIKWDMNRFVSEPGWPGYERDQRELWVRYVEGLYDVWGELRRRHPKIIWENCSGGGGRANLAVMGLSEQTWVSDNTLPPARLQMHEGYSQLFPASTMAAWVTDEQKEAYSLDFRFQVCMAGALGVGGDLATWSDAEMACAKGHIARYKLLRDTICHGDLYRLELAHAGPVSALMYVAKDKSEAVVFVYRTHESRTATSSTIYLAGLDPNALYAVEGSSQLRSGFSYGRTGLEVTLKDFSATNFRVQRAHE